MRLHLVPSVALPMFALCLITAPVYSAQADSLEQKGEEMGRLAEAAHARQKWGVALCTLAQYDEALAAFERAAETYRQAGDLEEQARAIVQIGQACQAPLRARSTSRMSRT